jgi:predicted transcriptional regulator
VKEGMQLNEEQFMVLKTMSEAKNRMDINMFSKKVNLSPAQTIQQIQELAKEGFLQKIGNGFGITDKGKEALKAFTLVPEETGFRFYYGIDRPTGLKANSLGDFYRMIKQISPDSAEFHLYRGDFEAWLKDVCKNTELAEEFHSVRASGAKGEELKTELLNVLDTEYRFKELM